LPGNSTCSSRRPGRHPAEHELLKDAHRTTARFADPGQEFTVRPATVDDAIGLAEAHNASFDAHWTGEQHRRQ
jgi:hypothetical protein